MATYNAETGSRVLREWNEQRALQRAVAVRSRNDLKRNFSGAEVGRLTASMQSWSGSLNADLDSSLVILRARARTLCANADIARRFLSLVGSNVVGAKGPTLQVRAKLGTPGAGFDKAANDAVEIHWARWQRTADLTGKMSLPHLFRVLVKAVARDGEALVRFVRSRSRPYGLALQVLEADRLDERVNQTLSNGNRIRQGVEYANGAPVAYYLRTEHPGENYNAGGQKTERVAAVDILHGFVAERGEQVRGYTWLHAVIRRLAMLDAYEEAAVVAARVGAAKMGLFTRTEDAAADALKTTADGKDADGTLQMSAEAGEFIEMPPGYSLESWNPEYPHQNFETFLNACLRGVAAGVDIAAHNLTGNMTDVNYSSARIAEMTEREIWITLQDWFIDAFVLPIYREWLNSALLLSQITFEQSGKALPIDKFAKFADASRFQGKRWEWVDPLKDGQANELLIRNALASRSEIAASKGRDFEDIVDELAQENAMLKAAGLPTEPPKPGAAGAAPANDGAPAGDGAAKGTGNDNQNG